MNEIRPDVTALVTRGACRHLAALGYSPLTEFRLPNGRRADVAGLARDGHLLVLEVKSGAADFRTDARWRDYLEFCDGFAFAVAPGFPADILPADTGLLVTDGFEAALKRPFVGDKLHAARRKAVTLRFARQAAARLWGQAEG